MDYEANESFYKRNVEKILLREKITDIDSNCDYANYEESEENNGNI